MTFHVETPRSDRVRGFLTFVSHSPLFVELDVFLLEQLHDQHLLLSGFHPEMLDSAKGRVFPVDLFSLNFPHWSHFFLSNHLDVVHMNGQESL